MRKFSSVLLAILTFWMSTWMVTDIHDMVSAGGDQPHPIFSAHPTDSGLIFQSGESADPSDCQVCSYDHGGHFGQALAATALVISFDYFHVAYIPAYPSGWFSHIAPPNYRPPIA